MANSNVSLSFRIFQNNQLVREERLSQSVIKLGKVASAHLRLDDETVSRMHAIIEVIGHDVTIIDLGSTRGTFVNGQRINKAKLQTGDSIVVGETRVELGMVVIDATATTRAPVSGAPAEPVVNVPIVPAPVVNLPIAAAVRPAVRPPVVPMPIARPAAPFQHAIAESADELGGARSVEVAAMLGDSVINVKHCMDPRGGKITSATWALFVAGATSLIASAIAFSVSVSAAATNKAALDHWVRVLHKPAYAFRALEISGAYDWLAFGGLALGLVAVTLGLARVRREKRSPYYRIGTAPGVELALEQAPAASFPLVAPAGDDFVFNYGAGMEGEMTVDGKSTPLSELAAAGRGHPSASTAGAIEIPIPPRARIHARAGQTTFVVSAVARPREQATPLFAVENRNLAYLVGSLAVHLGVWALLQTIPVEGSSANLELGVIDDPSIHASLVSNDDPNPAKPVDNSDTGDAGSPQMTKAMALEEGAAGKPTADRLDGHLRIKDNHLDPQVARQQAIEEARTAGILGSASLIQDTISALAATGDLSSGIDGANVYGPLFGAEGEGKGSFGMGRHGFGPGGGCSLPPCGIIGTGNYGTISVGAAVGDNWGGTNGHSIMRRHEQVVPPVVFGTPTAVGLDKSIIRRYIQRAKDTITYCYEKELLARPGIAGEIMIQFMISGDGTVATSSGSGFDTPVASCVASVIKSIAFPRTDSGGNVGVNYPFTFHTPGVR